MYILHVCTSTLTVLYDAVVCAAAWHHDANFCLYAALVLILLLCSCCPGEHGMAAMA